MKRMVLLLLLCLPCSAQKVKKGWRHTLQRLKPDKVFTPKLNVPIRLPPEQPVPLKRVFFVSGTRGDKHMQYAAMELEDAMISRFLEHGRVQVLNRNNLPEIFQEKDISLSPEANPATALSWGKMATIHDKHQDIFKITAINAEQRPQLNPIKNVGHEYGRFVFRDGDIPIDEVVENPLPDSSVPLAEKAFRLATSEKRDVFAQLRGRKVWVTGGDVSICGRLNKLGLDVTCDWRDIPQTRNEIVIRCGTIPADAAQTILDHLNLAGYRIRTHQGQSAMMDNSQCGELYEITLRN